MIVGTLVGVAAAAAAAYFVRERRYRAAFSLPAQRDDRLVCREGRPPIPLVLGPDGFTLPPGALLQGQTAFLTLSVAASKVGRVFDPYIEVEQGPVRYRQYFERGAMGRRSLNLSPLGSVDGHLPEGRVVLRGRALAWTAEGTLLTFDPPALDGKDVLVLAPHPDDAEIAAFGMYANPRAARSWVATITAGEQGSLDLSAAVAPGPADTAWKARLRVWDSHAIPGLGGVPVERCLNLVYPDRRLPELFREPTRAFHIACEQTLSRDVLRARNPLQALRHGGADCTWDGLIEDLRLLLESSRPGVVVAPHPLIEVHPDHVYTAVALDRALTAARHAPLVLLYAADVRDARLHPFGPSDAVVSLPPLPEGGNIADTVYSHVLSPEVRSGKYFAVQASHDLGAYPTGGPQTAGQLLEGARRELAAFVSGMGADPTDYTRRAPRPNEIYYVVSREGFSALVERTLATAGLASAGTAGAGGATAG